jgi:hypothetical protein
MNKAIAALCLGLTLAAAVDPASARVHLRRGADQTPQSRIDSGWGVRGHQREAPPWSFACTTDHGPSQCGEPIWIYGNQ